MELSRRALINIVSAVVSSTPSTNDENETSGYGMGAYGEAGYGGMPADCFIATAACGTESHADVIALRSFRDDVLLQSRCSRFAVKTYYSLSPPIARWISRSQRRRATVRRTIVSPASRLAAAVFNTDT